ncbi:Luciferase-like monooxygenase [Actinoalloteichus sp. GBA129-24]|uniref:Luciferase-like monooxygenase n=1 Tax=Actinoalloteichus fjordicus TaxID=1612552 RepID=A0AAC9LDW5_9PSEU|nr:Luciferase-like monooxygenase [Actinoalloteichus fjordicus]APU20882.1 Luciferase-like monooxygenase [Actinoalloteichus sp. GBA129-24]
MTPVQVGVFLPSPVDGETAPAVVVDHARHAEELGLESVWTGDHLIPASPKYDSTLLLAAVAATTERVKIGIGVLILSLRPVAWAAK